MSERRRLGTTELSVHPICFGGNVLGWTVDRDAGFAVLDAYVAAGGNFVDTADVYAKWVPGNAGGESETILGEWLRSRKPSDVVVATKVGAGLELGSGLAREQVLGGCEASLRRLGVETIDLYYAHTDDLDTDVDETVAAFGELVAAGKVRYLGASNHTAPRLAAALAAAERLGEPRYQVLQPRYNLVDRDDFGPELQSLCLEQAIGTAVYSVLASGFLTGKYRPGVEGTSLRAGGVRDRYLGDERALSVLAAASDVARERGATVAQVALAWVIAQPAVTCAIASATTAAQVSELLGATAVELSADELDRLGAAGTA